MSDYIFTQDWFTRHIPTLNGLVSNYKPIRILEIGSHEGRSTCWFIEQCAAAAQSGIHITCIDSWQWPPDPDSGTPIEGMENKVQNNFDHNTKLAISKSKFPIDFVKIRSEAKYALASLIAERKTYDFCYIDGSHAAHEVLSDAVMVFHLMQKRSTIVFDDYLWNEVSLRKRDITLSPKLAVDAFSAVFARKVYQIAKLPIDQAYFRKYEN